MDNKSLGVAYSAIRYIHKVKKHTVEVTNSKRPRRILKTTAMDVTRKNSHPAEERNMSQYLARSREAYRKTEDLCQSQEKPSLNEILMLLHNM